MERKPPRRTRERILATALSAFNDFGEPKVTTSAIADALNISPGNLYYHFRNKDAIIDALFEQFEGRLSELLDAPPPPAITFEDAWLFIHLLLETIWQYRFVYRDLNDLAARSRRLALHVRTLLERKKRAALGLCHALTGPMGAATPARELEALATNMVVVATYWLSYETAGRTRSFEDPAQRDGAMARGAWQVLSLLAPYLDDRARTLLHRLADEYLKD